MAGGVHVSASDVFDAALVCVIPFVHCVCVCVEEPVKDPYRVPPFESDAANALSRKPSKVPPSVASRVSEIGVPEV